MASSRLETSGVGYIPAEISASALTGTAELQRDLPLLDTAAQADFTVPFEALPRHGGRRERCSYLASSTLGEFPEPEAVVVLQQMRRAAGADGAIAAGTRSEEGSRLIHAAYNDAATASPRPSR